MKKVTDRKGFLAAAASAAGATGIIASRRPAEALSTARFKVVVLTDNDPNFIAELEWHIGPGGFLIQGYTFASASGTQYVLLTKQLA